MSPGDGGDQVLVVFSDGETLDSLPATMAEVKRLREAGDPPGAGRGRRGHAGTDPPARQRGHRRSATSWTRTATRSRRAVATTTWSRSPKRETERSSQPTCPIRPGRFSTCCAPSSGYRLPPPARPTCRPLGWIPLLIGALVLLLHTFTRRQAALVALAGLCCLPGTATAQQATPAERAMPWRRAAEAARAMAAARRGRGREGIPPGTMPAPRRSPRGTWAVARQALERASRSVDPDLRYRALYNLGLASLLSARQVPDSQAMLDAAEHAFREALLLQPARSGPSGTWSSPCAGKPPPSGGGGALRRHRRSLPAGRSQPEDADQNPAGISRNQADQILNSVEREERSTRQRHVRRDQGQPGEGGVRDW